MQIVNRAMAQRAFPGCVVLAVHKGEIFYQKAYGYYHYEQAQPLTPESIFDLASVTKVSATTVAVMKLYEARQASLEGRLGEYLPWVRGSNKQDLLIRDILLHQAGLVTVYSIYKETLQANGVPDTSIFSPVSETRLYPASGRKTICKKRLARQHSFTHFAKSARGSRQLYI
jgi:CubicO group peptidase (beta-lactamase class C family)